MILLIILGLIFGFFILIAGISWIASVFMFFAQFVKELRTGKLSGGTLALLIAYVVLIIVAVAVFS